MSTNHKTIIFGGGCFWCTEAIFKQLKGVMSVTPGYCGGHIENPTYEQICEKNTGHAEVINITYDTNIISIIDLMDVHLFTHDPTTLNRQGNDIGPQYRSVIFYNSDEDKLIISKHLDSSKMLFDTPIVTTIEPFIKFYFAENYHVNYYELNKDKPYCQLLINPKLKKLKLKYKSLLK